MAVNWSWKHRIGFIYFYSHDRKHRCKVNIYSGNCLGVLIYEFKELDEETGKQKVMYTFQGFWNDIHHLNRCLGLEKSYHAWSKDKQTKENIYHDDIVSIHLNLAMQESISIARAFAKAKFDHKIRINLYWKEIKA